MTEASKPEKKILAAGKFLRLVEEDGWEYAERVNVTGVVTIAAVNNEGKLLLVEQFRQPLDCRVLELPAGLAGDVAGQETEKLAQAAQRELLEETGYRAESMQEVTSGPTSAGMTTEVVTFFLAHGLIRENAGGGDASEEIQVHEIPLEEIDDWLEARHREGMLIDPKVYTGLYFIRYGK